MIIVVCDQTRDEAECETVEDALAAAQVLVDECWQCLPIWEKRLPPPTCSFYTDERTRADDPLTSRTLVRANVSPAGFGMVSL